MHSAGLAGNVCLATMVAYALLVESGLAWAQREPLDDEGHTAVRITLIYSSDLQSQLEPCGCVEGMLGGLPRQTTFIGEQAGEGNALLLLDGGNLLFPPAEEFDAITIEGMERLSGYPALLVPQLREKAKTVLACYDKMGWIAFAIGEEDLALGVEFLKEMERAAKISFLSANLVWPRSHQTSLEPGVAQRVFKSFLIHTIGDVRFGILGLTSSAGGCTDVQAMDPIGAAREILAKLEESTDFIVCLSNLGLSADRELAKAVPGIDIIVSGRTRVTLTDPLREGQAVIVKGNEKGKFLGRLKLCVRDKEASLTADVSAIDRAEALIAEYETDLSAAQEERDTADDDAARYAAVVRTERLTKELGRYRAEHERLLENAPKTGNSHRRKILLDA